MSTVNGAWRGPNIVKDGLVLYLDAGSPNSYYPTTAGTTWKNISTPNSTISGSLVNGAFYTGSNGGNIVFDGTNDYVVANTNTSFDNAFDYITIEAFVYFNTIPYLSQIFLNKENSFRLLAADVDSSRISIRYATSVTGWGSGTFIANTVLTTGWHHCVITYNGTTIQAYLDGQGDGSKSQTGTVAATPYPVYIGSYQPNGFPFNGRVGIIRLYNRALSVTEVLQNYNSQKSRFGL